MDNSLPVDNRLTRVAQEPQLRRQDAAAVEAVLELDEPESDFADPFEEPDELLSEELDDFDDFEAVDVFESDRESVR